MMSIVYPLDEIRSRLKPVFDAAPVYKAVLFGSYAKGKATESSDIDIVIDSRGELLNIEFYGVLEDITETLGKKVDLFEITEIKQNSLIYIEIQNEGVLLYDRQG
ncbi:MAG: nucleotidyltransferase domain-containing protein [Dethiobacter sp.]|nr:nucleotidyltransferase domain-containing protein [Dethiobacter sp.]